MAHPLTTCTFCGAGCGLHLETQGGKIVGVREGLRLHAVARVGERRVEAAEGDRLPCLRAKFSKFVIKLTQKKALQYFKPE